MAQQATTLNIGSRVAAWSDRPGGYNLVLLAFAFLVIVLVLMIKPEGLLGKPSVRKV